VAYDPSIVAAIRREAAKVDDPQKRNRYLRAALQTGIVESGIQNLHHGDADSQGWRQERASLYPNPTNVTASVRRFFAEAAQHDRGQPSWELAADVQRPAAQYRGRYKDVASEAAKLAHTGAGSDSENAAISEVSKHLSYDPAAPAASALATLARPQRVITAPTAPSYGKPNVAQLPATPTQPRQRLDTGAALEALQALQPTGGSQKTTTTTTRTASEQPQSTAAGTFKISGPQPDRLKPHLVSFAEKVAGVYGHPLTGKDGSSHSKLTVNGNVSQHYTGNATDIFEINGKPAVGKRLIDAGRAALIAAGMPRAKALKAPGGLYNVGGHQIIFGVNGTQYGGNHLDHLHISAR
jgi:hypothetical protein